MTRPRYQVLDQRLAYSGNEADILDLDSDFTPNDPLSLYMVQAIRLKSVNNLRHGFFGSSGGVSRDVWSSLNISTRVGDNPASVTENRSRLLDACANGSNHPKKLFTVHQTHGTNVVCVDGMEPSDYEEIVADALITTMPGAYLAVTTADCAPILFADPDQTVIGACHAGWRGAQLGIIGATVDAMIRHGARPNSIMAAIGPMIARESYQVGDDLRDRVLKGCPSCSDLFYGVDPDLVGGRWMFDFPGYTVRRLHESGIRYIERLHIDTMVDERFFSARRTARRQGGGRKGRQASVIGLDPS